MAGWGLDKFLVISNKFNIGHLLNLKPLSKILRNKFRFMNDLRLRFWRVWVRN